MIPSLFLLIFILCFVSSSLSQETSFLYNGFHQTDLPPLHLDGSARILPKGVLQLTNSTKAQIGHAFYNQPFQFSSSESISFSTHFVCALLPDGTISGHGIAFVVSHFMDFTGAESSRFFGIFNSKSNGSTSGVLAIELDISQARDVGDINDNHVGIDVNTVFSNVSANASYFSDKEKKNISISLLNKDPLQVWVDYEGTTLNVTIAPLKSLKPTKPLLSSKTINLTEILHGRRMFVGFSASTGSISSYQYILGWSFSKTMASLQILNLSKLPKVPHINQNKKSSSPVLLNALISLIGFMVLGILCLAYRYRRNKYAEVREEWEKEYGPLRYSYKSLYLATKGFHKNGFLGRGGFGEVYKGTLSRSKEVAVKRVSQEEGGQGMKQFVAEIVTMRRLKHRNLVPILGYCRRKHELLLVSEYMPNGSLDHYLFSTNKPVLPWWRRLMILKDIASALSYLHTEAYQVVIHRDIKASNVMLDADFNGRLGDFGMSKLYERGSDPTTTVAVGTLGYMAPELTTMGASTGTDVYAFGVFLLEVSCGRRPVDSGLGNEKRFLINWISDCWKRSCLIDARDSRLVEFSSEEIEKVLKLGLLCANLAPEAVKDNDEKSVLKTGLTDKECKQSDSGITTSNVVNSNTKEMGQDEDILKIKPITHSAHIHSTDVASSSTFKNRILTESTNLLLKNRFECLNLTDS